MTRLIILVALAASLAGCGRIPTPSLPFLSKAQPSESLPFQAKLSAERRSPDVTVTVNQGAADLEAVRESVRFPATVHCLKYFGSSRIDWASVPGQPDAWIGQRIENGATVYSGRCDAR